MKTPQQIRQIISKDRLRMRRDLIRSHGHTWPGGYPMLAVMDDGGMLCHECCRLPEVYRSTRDGDRDGWTLAAVQVHWEGPAVVCDHCGVSIASAYGDPDAEAQS